MQHLEEVYADINELVGEPTDPSSGEVMNLWKSKIQSPPLRTIQYIIDVKLNRMILARGMSLLGFRDDMTFSGLEFMNLFHENQRLLLIYQTLSIYEIFLSDPDLIKRSNPIYCTSRGMKDKSGNYWLVHQTATPIQYDEKGHVVKYYNEYRVLGKYRGEALETNIYTSPELVQEQRQLNIKMDGIKSRMIHVLGFTLKTGIILESMARGTSKKDMLELIEAKSTRTIDYHRRKILDAGKEAFPLNDFRSASDVVDYLVRQKII